MDIEYLLILQKFREGSGSILAPFVMNNINRAFGRFIGHAFFVFYTMIIVPKVMKRIVKKI